MKWSEKSLSHVQLFATPWTVAQQAPPSMEFSRQDYWSGLPFPSPGDLPDLGIEPRSPTLQTDSLPSDPPGNPYWAWPHSFEQDPVSPSVSLSNQEVPISCLSFSIRGQTEWKPQSQNTNQSDQMDHSLVLTQWNYESFCVGPTKMGRSCWRILKKI